MARKPPAIADLVLDKAVQGYRWATKGTHSRPGTGSAPKGGEITWVPISRVNLIVGPNNSGKSRFMRAIVTGWSGNVEFAGFDSIDARTRFQNMSRRLKGLAAQPGDVPKHPSVLRDGYGDYIAAAELQLQKVKERLKGRPDQSVLDAEKDLRNLCGFARGAPNLNSPALCEQRQYIPMLRGVRQLEGEPGDIYAGTTITDYAIAREHIFTGRQMYDRVDAMRNGPLKGRDTLDRYHAMLSRTLYDRRSIELIPRHDDKTLYVRIGNETERAIHHLGDGVQAQIILTFRPFLDEGGVYFIEEPEHSLHPAAQRQILDYYTQCEGSYFFITTHSNHLLELTADYDHISVFRVSKDPTPPDANEADATFTVEQVEAGDESLLRALGVRASSVFLSNATIWVEGITDRWLLRALLEAYMKPDGRRAFVEDIHYSFVEYAGSNITHWSFLDKEAAPMKPERTTARLALVMDADGNAKLERKKELKAALGERLFILDCREIENLLPDAALASTVKTLAKLSDAPAYVWDEYKDEYLGAFIEDSLPEKKGKRGWNKFAANSGTIERKTEFMQEALRHVRDLAIEEWPSAAQELAAGLYAFVEGEN